MDRKIEQLTSTTFGGRRFTRQQLVDIQRTVTLYSTLSRRELAHTLCEHLQWVTPKGINRVQTCLNALEEMELCGIITLPKLKQRKKASQKKIQWTDKSNEQAVIDSSLDDLLPISLKVVTEKEEIVLWNEWVDRYHYLGYKRPIGSHLRYTIIDRHGRTLGCLCFSFATTSLTCRDQWIGWTRQDREKHLHLVINNNRFLIFPWVKVSYLASKALSGVVNQIADDWQTHHGYRPVLLETFVDPSHYKGTCYKASNWQCIGQTAGSKSSNTLEHHGKKEVYLYPLGSDGATRDALLGIKNTEVTKKEQPFKTVVIDKDNQIYLWQKIITVVAAIAENFDTQWQKRQRVLSTFLIILFIFKLVFSKNKQGYGSTIAELWEYCHHLNIQLPQEKPVVPAAFCNARKKMDEGIFKTLNTEIIRTYESERKEHRWNGHRLFAVDGTKINLPKKLEYYSYQKPSESAHYPYGLVSCLYQLKSEIPYDFELASHLNERLCALNHLQVLNTEDIVVYDRGYFSYVLLHAHHKKGVHAVFRLKSNSIKVIDEFIKSADKDRVVTIKPTQKHQKELLSQYPDLEFTPLSLRLIKYVVADTTYIIGTTLIDIHHYPANEFPDLYHSRWGIEELYKISKVLIDVEDFHAKTERGVKQELFAHFVLVTLGKIFLNQTNDALLLSAPRNSKQRKANQKNCFIAIARNIEGLFLGSMQCVSKAVNTITTAILTCYQRVRPNRSYNRISHKIAKKWRPSTRRTIRTTVTAVG